MSEVPDDGAPVSEDLPRFFMPRDQKSFGILMELLEVGDESLAVAAWELIQMLSTNAELYKSVLTLDIAKREGSLAVNWDKFFDRSSTYKLLYTIQIVQAVLEDGQAGPVPVNIINIGDFPGGMASEPPLPTQEEPIDGDMIAEPLAEAAPIQI